MSGRKQSDTLYEQVVKELRTRIMTGVYKKGELLPSEKDLIDSMGVSRITIRKAISMLADAGLIRTSQGKKSEVIFDSAMLSGNKNMSEYAKEYIENFRAVTQIRLMLEPEIARQAALTATQADIKKLESADDFHRGMIEILNNKELIKIYDNLIVLEEGNEPPGIITPDKQEDISSVIEIQHKKIMDAIRTHNGEYAYFYMKEHTQYICDMYEQHFKYFYNL